MGKGNHAFSFSKPLKRGLGTAENEASPAAPAEPELAASTACAGEPASSNSYNASENGSAQTALRSTITESASDARTPVGPSSSSRATEDVQLSAQAGNGAAASSAGSEVHASVHASTTASSHNAGPTAVSARSGNLQATGAARSGAADLSAAARVGAAPDQAAAKTGMAVTWLGTSSGAPTLKRNVSCISLRLPQSTFLVDAGEGSCRQVGRQSCPTPMFMCPLQILILSSLVKGLKA